MKFKFFFCFVGYKVSDLLLEMEFNIKIIVLIKGEKVLNGLGILILEYQVENYFEENYELEEEDQLVCYGFYKNFMDFWKVLQQECFLKKEYFFLSEIKFFFLGLV